MMRGLLSFASRQGGSIELVDAAYWMKGCSSLGNLRYAAVVRLSGGTGADEHALVDLKEAITPAAPVASGAAMPADPAERVLAGALALSPHLGERMIAARMLGKSFIVRELMPQDLKIEVDQFSQAEAVMAARYLAYVVGKAHARQMDIATRTAWRRTLLENRMHAIDAPHWLWESIVDLSGSHEIGYLQHCRRYAMMAAA